MVIDCKERRPMVSYDRFIPEWLRRADRGEVIIDDGDRFISLWIAFNGWLKKEYGENRREFQLIENVIDSNDMKAVFEKLKNGDGKFQESLNKLSCYRVINMRDEHNEAEYKQYDGNFSSLINTIYQIRCNLFHGRKNVDDNKRDSDLIGLALNILKPLFKEYLKEYEGIY